MTQNEILYQLITSLINEEVQYKNLKIPDDYEERKRVFRSLMNIRPPRPADPAFLRLQDEFLTGELAKKEVVDALHLPVVQKNKRLCLWRGDITRLRIDSIVNAANNQMLGCFVPCHNCIDNAIHSAAGIQLRAECERIMTKQGYGEPTGTAKITKGYNLPSKYVLHTVGPIIYGYVTNDQIEQLAGCYRSCLDLAVKNGLHSVAFCCISTGEYRFPNKLAAKVAVKTVSDYLDTDNGQIERIVFNVFKQEDYDIYKKLLG